MASEVVSLKAAKTVNGTAVRISTMGSRVMIDNARVMGADIQASSGVMHVIHN